MMTACSGLIDGGGGGELTAAEIAARKAFKEKAYPVLTENCVICHNGSRANIGFAVGANDTEVHDTLMAYEPQVVNLDAPGSSRLLTKGLHEGPALDALQTSDLLEWINLEREANPPGGDVPSLETPQFLARICTAGLPDNAQGTCPFNDVDLSAIGSDGTKIRFIVQALGSGLYMTNLKLVPGPTGAFLDHPLFVSWPADGSDPKPDTIDRFFNVKMNLMPSASPEDQQIGGGTAAFVGFLANDKLSIHFKDLEVFVPDDTNPTAQVGCKQLAMFKANAAGPLNANCVSCHGGSNANATSAMNLTSVNSMDDVVAGAACNEALNRVNLTDTANSGLYLAPLPTGTNHPFKFGGVQANYDAFKAAVDPWVQAEKQSP